tara:strand:+ start:179 stop:2101 length:1923 start_codon:yes stop_codon:yes gene_type:complete
MAVEKQMEMDLGEVPDNTIGVDPVSGNEIPLGSTAENVRDDIPANLSEGEIVIAADVVNFHGVKLFEDLRKEAKMGYAQMAEEGRIGGEPMMGDEDIDIEFTIEDLEVMDAPDAAEPEDAFLGKFFAGIREANKKQQEANNQKRDRSYKAIKARAQANKGKPKNRAEAILQALQNAFRDDSDKKRPTLKSKPATSDDAPGPSIAEQINFGGDYRDKKEKTTTKKPAQTKGAGEVTKAYTGSDDKQNVRYYDKGFLERLTENLGLDEGGLVEEPFYSQKGGFDMEEAASGSSGVQVIEYMNDEGHRIFITFIDGVPQTEIPEGYYPVGDPIDINTVINAGDPSTIVGGSAGGSDSGGGGGSGGSTMDMPEGINYKELTMDELKDMVNDMSSFGTKLSGLSFVTKAMMKLQHNAVRKEIERRLLDPNTSEVDKMRLRNLKELAEREQPGLIESIADKLTGKEFEKRVAQIPKPVIPDTDYSDPTLAPTPYTPDAQTASTTTTPGVSTYDEVPTAYDPIPPAQSGFGGMGPDPAEQFGGSQTRFEDPDNTKDDGKIDLVLPEIEVRGDSRSDRDAQRRRDRQEANKNMAGQSTRRKTRTSKSATRGLSSKQKTGGASLDSRFGISGLEKGGLATKKSKKKKSK